MNWRVRFFVKWLAVDPLPVWSALAVPVIILFACGTLPVSGDLGVRIAGYALTLIGVALVAWGVLTTQRLFERPRYSQRIWAWLRRFTGPFKRRSVIGFSASGLAVSTGSATATVPRAQKKRSVNDRLRLLEENLSRLEGHVNGSLTKIANEVQELHGTIDVERSRRSEEIEKVRGLLEQTSAGALDWELVGLVWLAVGQAIAYFPGGVGIIFGFGV